MNLNLYSPIHSEMISLFFFTIKQNLHANKTSFFYLHKKTKKKTKVKESVDMCSWENTGK